MTVRRAIWVSCASTACAWTRPSWKRVSCRKRCVEQESLWRRATWVSCTSSARAWRKTRRRRVSCMKRRAVQESGSSSVLVTLVGYGQREVTRRRDIVVHNFHLSHVLSLPLPLPFSPSPYPPPLPLSSSLGICDNHRRATNQLSSCWLQSCARAPPPHLFLRDSRGL